ncbi:MAG: hypothetical protein P4L57_14425 [Rhizomicrobium sp.]|nr:hypothetical protein [Rhizomicrobium sp.]
MALRWHKTTPESQLEEITNSGLPIFLRPIIDLGDTSAGFFAVFLRTDFSFFVGIKSFFTRAGKFARRMPIAIAYGTYMA